MLIQTNKNCYLYNNKLTIKCDGGARHKETGDGYLHPKICGSTLQVAFYSPLTILGLRRKPYDNNLFVVC